MSKNWTKIQTKPNNHHHTFFNSSPHNTEFPQGEAKWPANFNSLGYPSTFLGFDGQVIQQI
jgi:hypothetical protein